jgi:hypothetical protein
MVLLVIGISDFNSPVKAWDCGAIDKDKDPTVKMLSATVLMKDFMTRLLI